MTGLAVNGIDGTPATAPSYTRPMALMMALYFCIGFITALNDILVPHFKDLFHLSNFESLLVQFCFFGAYFLMSLPSGWLVGRLGYKQGILLALGIMGCGLLLFVPASLAISYPLFLLALFIVGSGLALLQVAINPYVNALGRPDTAAARITVCGFLNSLATTVAPKAGAAFIFIAAGATTAQLARSVRLPYALLGGFAFLLALVTLFVRLPAMEQETTSTDEVRGSAWDFAHLRLAAAAIFAYVGAEVAIGSILIGFFSQPAMGGYTHAAAAIYVTYYWGGAMIGRLIGSFTLLKVRAERALLFVAAMALLMVSITVFGHGHLAALALVSCGLFNSVMWPCIFPLGIRGLGRLTSQGSGILITMVVGGAVVPEMQGWLADRFGYQHSLIVVLLCYAYLVYFAAYGYRAQDSGVAVTGAPVPLEGR